MTPLVRFATAGVLASLVLAACGESTMDSTETLEGQWEIEQIAEEGAC